MSDHHGKKDAASHDHDIEAKRDPQEMSIRVLKDVAALSIVTVLWMECRILPLCLSLLLSTCLAIYLYCFSNHSFVVFVFLLIPSTIPVALSPWARCSLDLYTTMSIYGVVAASWFRHCFGAVEGNRTLYGTTMMILLLFGTHYFLSHLYPLYSKCI